MRKILLISALAFLCYMPSLSQTINFGALGGSMKADEIPKENLELPQYIVTYDYTFVKDASKPNERRSSITLLQVGKRYNRFCDYNSLLSDSINDVMANTKNGASNGFSQMFAYKKKIQFSDDIIIDKQKNQEIILNHSAMIKTYQYVEEIPQIDWNLIEGDTLIADKHCQKATCELFGRKYVAWYCPDVDLPYGPYKFQGLPGLIFKVTDIDSNFDFTLRNFRKAGKNDISIYLRKDKSIIKTDRTTFRKIYRNFCANPVSALEGNDMLMISDEVKSSVKSRPYNPIELE